MSILLVKNVIIAGEVSILDFGEKIKFARESAGITQCEMAAKIPMNQSNYSKIERGLQEPSLEQFRQICQILELDPSYLLDISSPKIQKRDELLLHDIKQLIAKYK